MKKKAGDYRNELGEEEEKEMKERIPIGGKKKWWCVCFWDRTGEKEEKKCPGQHTYLLPPHA